MSDLQPTDWEAVWLSLKVGFTAVICMLPPAMLAAWVLARKQFPGKVLVEGFVHLPLVLPPVVTGYLLLISFGRGSFLGGLLESTFGLRLAFETSGAILAAAIMGFPLMVRPYRLALELVDRRLEIAAATLGASPWHVFRTVTLPLAMPGLLTGLVLAFVRALGEFGATMTFAGNLAGETRTLPLAVFTYLQVPGKERSALLLCLLSVVMSLGALVASELYARRLSRAKAASP